MSLYDGLGVDTDTKKESSSSSGKPDVSGWSAGIRMMQSHLRMKKAALTEAQRKLRVATLAPVVDLKKAKTEDEMGAPQVARMSPPRPGVGPPRSRSANFSQGSPMAGSTPLMGDIVDEYDPGYPNEYDKVVKKMREKRQKEREQERQKEIDERRKRDRDRGRERGRDRDRDRGRDRERSPQGFSRRPDSDDEEDQERQKRRSGRSGAAIAPPTKLIQEDSTPNDEFAPPPPVPRDRPYAGLMKKKEADPERSTTPPPGTPFSETEVEPSSKVEDPLQAGRGGFQIPVGMGADSVAAKIMAKYGFKSGKGLGKKEQGISTALVVEKTSRRGGKIIEHGKDNPDIDMLPPPGPLPKQQVPASEISETMKNPTKVVLLRNMVGPGEVDDELQPETAEECSKYGEVSKVIVYEEPNAEEEEAVRIFVEFVSIASAVKAVVDLNGRFFGGRIVKATFYDLDKFKRFELSGPA